MSKYTFIDNISKVKENNKDISFDVFQCISEYMTELIKTNKLKIEIDNDYKN